MRYHYLNAIKYMYIQYEVPWSEGLDPSIGMEKLLEATRICSLRRAQKGPISLIRTHPFGKVVHHFPDLIPIQVQALHSAAAD